MIPGNRMLRIDLASGAGLALAGGAWARVHCRTGTLWITSNGPVDMVLEHGHSSIAEGPAWMSAPSGATLTIAPLRPRPARLRRTWLRGRRALKAAYLLACRRLARGARTHPCVARAHAML